MLRHQAHNGQLCDRRAVSVPPVNVMGKTVCYERHEGTQVKHTHSSSHSRRLRVASGATAPGPALEGPHASGYILR
jgi:hypothetical protein